MPSYEISDQRTSDWVSAGYQVVRSLLPESTCALIWKYVQLKKELGRLWPPDSRVRGAPRLYGDTLFEALLSQQLPTIERVVGEALWPSYSYLRLHSRGAELPKHLDRDPSEIAVTIVIGGDEIWPLWLGTKHGDVALSQHPGDAIVYRGREIPHWREPYTGQEQLQGVLFYVRQAGDCAAYRYDSRPGLGHPPVKRPSVKA
jgi:hypothetical protein